VRIANNTRSRKKLNYNSFYNSGLKKTNFLKQNPQNRSTYVQALLGETTTRGSISTPFTSGIVPPPQAEMQKYYVIEEISPIGLQEQSFEEVINEAEDGELLAIEAVTDSPLITIEVVVYGLGNSPNIINNYSINEMVRRGRGLTPGEVEQLPGGRSKDQVGTPRRYYPFVSRYKDDDLIDYLNDSRRYFVFVYEPSTPMPYSSLIVNVKNTSTEGGKTVDSINIHRRVFGSPLAENLTGTPIDSFELFKQPQPAPAVPVAPVPIAPTTSSPYVQNWYQRQQEAIAAANAPELIPDEFTE
jgi:hypothetical protein